jgi:hypothetical protein
VRSTFKEERAITQYAGPERIGANDWLQIQSKPMANIVSISERIVYVKITIKEHTKGARERSHTCPCNIIMELYETSYETPVYMPVHARSAISYKIPFQYMHVFAYASGLIKPY